MDIRKFCDVAVEVVGKDAIVGMDRKGFVVLALTCGGLAIVGRGLTMEEALADVCTCDRGRSSDGHREYCSRTKIGG